MTEGSRLERPPSHPFLDWPGPIAFAHRGGAGEAPENTMRSFAAAAALGYRYVETDVHATVDGTLVAFHDDRLDRLTDRTGRIAALTFAEVSHARVLGTGDARDPIPTLEELLGDLPDLRVNIDPKEDEAVEPLIASIRRTASLRRVCVGSFSGERLARIRAALGPGLCTALSPSGVRALRLASWGVSPLRGAVQREGAACVQVPVRSGAVPVVDRRFVRLAHELGLPVHVWTVDEPAEMERLLALGVDGLMTDRPALLRDVLQRRGEWVDAGARR